MVRETSIKAYNEIKANGLLSAKRMEVLEAIVRNAPCTSAEAFHSIRNTGNPLSQSRARFTELRDLGVIYEKGTRHCRVTGKDVIEWDLTGNLPDNEKLKAKKSKNKYKAGIDYIIKRMNQEHRFFADEAYLAELLNEG